MKKMNAQNNLPTLDELKRYHEGGLEADQRKAIEAQAAQNPLVAEALEGFAVVPAFAAVPDVSTFLNSAATLGSSTSAAAAAAATTKAGITLWSAKTLIVAGITAAVATAAVVITTPPEKATTTLEAPATDNISNTANEEIATLPTPTEESPATPAEQHAASRLVIATTTPAATNHEGEAERSALQPATQLPLTNTAESDLVPLPAEPQTVQVQTGLAAVGIQKILNYKVADYTKLRNTQWPSFETELNGLPAPFETEEARKKAEQDNLLTTQIPYMHYMRQCIQAMDQMNYALAVKKLKVIAEQYPDDVNAQFYTGRCLYLQGEYEKAIARFDVAIKNVLSVFTEEAEFYKAKSLKELGRVDEAKALFLQIVQKQKFYAEMAAKELD